MGIPRCLCLAALLYTAIAAPLFTTDCDAEEYDFIIVGGGTAGVALATRLSQRLPGDRILLLEAGPTALDEPRINIPGRKGSTLGTIYDWNFTTVPQEAAAGRKITASRGKVLGGSSALNLLTWDRASVADYDSWATLGNPSWDWNSMIEAMVKVENFTGINTTTYGYEGVGVGGPVDTVINRIQPAQQSYWVPTVTQFGIPNNLNSLGGDPLGVMLQPSNIDITNYTRSYSANAYLPLAGSNLEVRDNTLVRNVVLTQVGNNLTATGVLLATNVTIKATKEVIIAAGTMQSPGLLERSGVGSADVLSALGIDVLYNLTGVGEHLQDHVRVQTSYQLRDNYTSFDLLRNTTAYAEQLVLYNENLPSLLDYTASDYSFLNWRQVLGADGASDLISLATAAYGNTSDPVDQEKLKYLTTSLGDNVPQLEIVFSDGYTGVKGYPLGNSSLYGKGFSTFIAAMQHPFSKGSIHINSLDPAATPLIDPNYISNDYEVEALVQAVKFNRRIATTYPFSQAWVDEYEPGPAVHTDDEIRQYVRNTVLTIYHPVATCSMLPLQDGGVVDPTLKVYGTSNLRVVDASIMPILPAAHMQTVVYAIAERAADFITTQWA